MQKLQHLKHNKAAVLRLEDQKMNNDLLTGARGQRTARCKIRQDDPLPRIKTNKLYLRVDPKQGLEQSSYHILLQALVVSEGTKAIFCEYLG